MEDGKINIIKDSFHQNLLLAAVSLGLVMDALDGSIVNVALPTMAADFCTDTGTIAWVIITYLLMMAGFILVFGRIADGGYMKKIFIAGIILFTAGSAACGLSFSLSLLLASRILQGFGAAMIAAVAPLLCVRCLPPRMIGMAFGVLAATSSVGFAAGPAIGGFLTHFLSWHWIFLINIPVGIFGIFFAKKALPDDILSLKKTPFDYLGAFFLFAAMVFAVLALQEATVPGMPASLIHASVALFLIFILAFAVRELKTEFPLINIRIFMRWQFTSVLAAFFLINIIFMGVIYLLPFYLSLEMSFDAALSGLYLLIPPLVTCIISIPFGKLSDKYGRRWFVAAACVLMILFNAIFAIINQESGIILLITGLCLMGCVFGIAGGAASGRIVDTAPKGEEAAGSSLMIMAIYLGGVIGTALYAALFTFATSSNGLVFISELSGDMFLYGFEITMSAGAFASFIPLILSLIVREEKNFKKSDLNSS